MKKIFILLIGAVVAFSFDYFKVYNISEFKTFKLYKVKNDYIQRILKMPKGEISEQQKENLLYLYEKEKMIRDTLLILHKKYKYEFMPYIATLTQQHLFILNQFFKKYEIQTPKDSEFVGKFDNVSIQQEYQKLLTESLKNKKIAAKLSVKFMNDLVREYQKVVFNGVPNDIKRMLLKLNAFNKKVLYRFKKGLRNIEIGLPVE